MPGFSDYSTYRQHIISHLQVETPHHFGLHPNAEIGVLTASADELFATILELEPADMQGTVTLAVLDIDSQVCDKPGWVPRELDRVVSIQSSGRSVL